MFHPRWMEGYDATTYGQRIAEVYDDWHTEARPGQLELLCELAGNGPVLELGVGTGRLALPLTSRGLEVHGIDSSGAMLEKLREKPGGESVAVTLGDFRDFDLSKRFSLIFVVFNTLFTLPDQHAQIGLFFQRIPPPFAWGAIPRRGFCTRPQPLRPRPAGERNRRWPQ